MPRRPKADVYIQTSIRYVAGHRQALHSELVAGGREDPIERLPVLPLLSFAIVLFAGLCGPVVRRRALRTGDPRTGYATGLRHLCGGGLRALGMWPSVSATARYDA
jgi:hypothetical protein